MASYVSKVGTKKMGAGGGTMRVAVKAGTRKPNVPKPGSRGSKMGTAAAQRRGAAAVKSAAAQRKYNANFKPRGSAPRSQPRQAGPRFSSSRTAGGKLVDAINAPREIGEFLKNLGK